MVRPEFEASRPSRRPLAAAWLRTLPCHRKWPLLTDAELRRAFAAAYGPRTVVQACPASCFWPHNVVASRMGTVLAPPTRRLASGRTTARRHSGHEHAGLDGTSGH